MALNDTALNLMAEALADAALYASLHTAAPNAGGSNESTATRLSIPWTAATGGDISLVSALPFTGGTPSGPATHIGLWSAASGGTFYGSFALTGDQTFNAAGEYTVNSLSLNGSAA